MRDVNAWDRRSGTLWAGRYASSPIETEAQWLACGRYVELNPVRARMVKRPEPYDWSSSRSRAGLSAWTWPDRDPLSRLPSARLYVLASHDKSSGLCSG